MESATKSSARRDCPNRPTNPATAGGEAARLYRRQMFEYLQEMWPGLRSKWVDHKALELAFAPENPLGKWRQVIEELYRIHLPLEALALRMEEDCPSVSTEH